MTLTGRDLLPCGLRNLWERTMVEASERKLEQHHAAAAQQYHTSWQHKAGGLRPMRLWQTKYHDVCCPQGLVQLLHLASQILKALDCDPVSPLKLGVTMVVPYI